MKMKPRKYISSRSPRHACLEMKSERGQALTELAVSIPLLLVLMLGIIEVGTVAFASISVSDAAMAAVQYGTLKPTSAADTVGIQNAASTDAPNLPITTTSSLSCICSDGSASTCQSTDCPGANIETILTVDTQTTVYPVIRVPGLPNSFTLRGQAIQKVLQ